MTIAASVNLSGNSLQLFVDGAKVTQTSNLLLNAAVNMTPGTHRIAVQAVANNIVMAKVVKYVTITTPPVGKQVLNLQESSSWLTCGSCGNNSGNAKLATYEMTRGLTTPAIDNTSTSAQFSIGGPYPYTDAYWYIKDPAIATPVQSLTYDFYLYVPAATGKSPQAIEFECQQTVNGYVYNFAWQADYASHSWRTFDYVNKKWIPTTIPFAGFTTDTWHHITAQYHTSGTNSVHDAITVDGVTTTVNITRPAKYTGQSWNSMTNAFQLDMNSVPTAYSVYVDKMSVTYQ